MTLYAPRTERDTLHERLIAAGCSPSQASDRSTIYFAATSALARLCDASRSAAASAAFLVPGRIEFLGKHTDYAGGRSLLCVVDRGIAIAAAPRTDRLVRVVDAKSGPPVSFALDPDLAVTAGHWSNYAMTVVRRIARNFPDSSMGRLTGADIAFASNLPPSSGMSSSSALVTALFLAMAKINRLGEHPQFRENISTVEDLAGYLGTIENGQTFRNLAGDKGVGTFGGSEDHTAILCSKPGMLRQYAFCPVRHERDVPLPKDHVLAICSSGVVAEKTGSARDSYNALSLSVRDILKRWNEQTQSADQTLADVVDRGHRAVNRLRSILAESIGSPASITNSDRLEQFIAESTQIIPAAAAALSSGRLETLGHLVARSQEGAERLLNNQVPETIFLAKSARENGAVAASSFGAGFGGSVWALVSRTDAEAFISAWRSRYARQFPNRVESSSFFLSEAGPPALDVYGDSRGNQATRIDPAAL